MRLRRLVLIIERNAGSLGRATGSKLRCRRLKNSCYRQPRCQTTDNEAACRGRLEGVKHLSVIEMHDRLEGIYSGYHDHGRRHCHRDRRYLVALVHHQGDDPDRKSRQESGRRGHHADVDQNQAQAVRGYSQKTDRKRRSR